MHCARARALRAFATQQMHEQVRFTDACSKLAALARGGIGDGGLARLRRLLRIRDLEEEQSRIALEAALSNLGRWKALEGEAEARGQRGRRLITASAGNSDSTDRRAAVAEVDAAARAMDALATRLEEAQWHVDQRRGEFQACRMQQRQVETLIREAEVRERAEAERKGQQALDDWYRTRRNLPGPAQEDDQQVSVDKNGWNDRRENGTT